MTESVLLKFILIKFVYLYAEKKKKEEKTNIIMLNNYSTRVSYSGNILIPVR